MAEVSLNAEERKLRASTMQSTSMTVGWLRYSCMKSTMSEKRTDLVVALTKWKQQQWLRAGTTLKPLHP